MRGAVFLLLVGCQSAPVVGPMPPCMLGACPWSYTLQHVGKVDLLFMIDNSASMGDKQELLARAVPDLVDRLLIPNCVLESDPTHVVPRGPDRACPDGSKLEFAPLADIHLGIVTSSLGGGGATDICDPNGKVCLGGPEEPCGSRHNDDRGHLINRSPVDWNTGYEAPLADAEPSNFLAWSPDGDRARFVGDFQTLVRGVGEFGCGLEAQMEAWYRFLVQPDPWDSIQLDTSQSPAAERLVGIDATILEQRHDFLRPDSALAVIVVTDEEDSWSDPMWLGGRGWITRAQNNTFSMTGQLPHGTSACSTSPGDPACTWCGLPGSQTDPSCAANKGLYGPKEDGLNVRYTNDMKRRYGMNPQFPVQRYVDGLRSALVPDRQGEHFDADGTFSNTYVGRKTCRNPIYASALPADPTQEICKLAPGSRTSDLVFFALIGGLPADLVGADWTRILGKDPATYQSEGIDPRMIESITPRPGVIGDWDTTTSKVGIDLEYACTFDLPAPKDCTKLPQGATCDCGGSYAGPLCAPNPADNGNPTLQVRGKAYPTIRELRVAKALDKNAIVASICARTVDEGYRPAMRKLVDRLSDVLGDPCLPQALARRPDGTVGCTVRVGTNVLDEIAADPGSCPACTFAGKPTCAGEGEGWCYVDGAAAGVCPLGSAQRVVLAHPTREPITLQCEWP